MPDSQRLGLFLVTAVVAAGLWGRLLWWCDQRFKGLNAWVFLLMTRTRRPAGEVRALLLSTVYCGFGGLAAVLFLVVWNLDPRAIAGLSASHLPLMILGIIGEISLTNLLVDVGCKMVADRGPERFLELREIPWMRGLRDLPRRSAVAVGATAGLVEELFFRGVLLQILITQLAVAPWMAVILAGGLFTAEQMVQLRTPFQAMVIGSSCVAISLVGGLLVVLSHSALPAMLCHASFVVFFLNRASNPPAPPERQRLKWAT